MKQRTLIAVALALAGMVRLWSIPPSPSSESAASPTKQREPIKPIPLQISLDTQKVSLGRMLFEERKLSRDNTVSCATCHDLHQGGADRRKYPIGVHQAEGQINTPTVFNSAANFKQFWDGRAATLEDQIDGPITSAMEMGSTWTEVVSKLRTVPEYVAAFRKVYPDGIEPKNVRNAIAEFERSLITPNSRFDQFLRGDNSALSADEKEGYRKFKSYGCTSCHQGINVGGNMFETLGGMADYFKDHGGANKMDLGRYNVTGREEDRYVFKVPSLRNIALTPPYLHNGSAATLEQAVTIMGQYQLGEQLPGKDVEQIVKFLQALTGEFEGHPL